MGSLNVGQEEKTSSVNMVQIQESAINQPEDWTSIHSANFLTDRVLDTYGSDPPGDANLDEVPVDLGISRVEDSFPLSQNLPNAYLYLLSPRQSSSLRRSFTGDDLEMISAFT